MEIFILYVLTGLFMGNIIGQSKKAIKEFQKYFKLNPDKNPSVFFIVGVWLLTTSVFTFLWLPSILLEVFFKEYCK